MVLLILEVALITVQDEMLARVIFDKYNKPNFGGSKIGDLKSITCIHAEIIGGLKLILAILSKNQFPPHQY